MVQSLDFSDVVTVPYMLKFLKDSYTEIDFPHIGRSRQYTLDYWLEFATHYRAVDKIQMPCF